MFVANFDVIRGVAIDYMHSTLLGVVKMLLTLCSDKSYKGEPWSVCSRDQRKVFKNWSPFLHYSSSKKPDCQLWAS